MRKYLIAILTAVSVFELHAKSTYSCCFDGETVTDVYDIKLKVGVPRIYDNTKSKGYRKYQWQIVKGEMHITYSAKCPDECGYFSPRIELKNMVNMTHKINGKYITYSCIVNNDGEDYGGPMTRVNVIGNNKSGIFNQASVCFYVDAEPSYNIGEDDEDNSLLITLGGYGVVNTLKWYPYYFCGYGSVYKKYYQYVGVISKLRGFLSGTLGCGCKAYGHKSPTRVMGYYGPTQTVDDVAAVFGQWIAVYRGRL